MNHRVDVELGRWAPQAGESAICGILAMLEVDGEQRLFIRIGSDGGIHRLGTGSVDRIDRDRFIGTTTPDAFERVRAGITPELLQWCGRWRSHPSPRGAKCELMIGFKQSDGTESMMGWRYGSHSQWPPEEVLAFVADLVEATEPWYQDQKDQIGLQAKRAAYEWWEFFRLPHA